MGGRLIEGGCVVLLVTGALCACGGGLPRAIGNPHPHGRLMAQLKPTLSAIPSTVHIFGQQFVPPNWDSCDGVKSTYGWDDVTVTAQFDHVKSPDQTVSAINASLHKLGWVPDSDSSDGAWYWKRKRSNGSKAAIQLLGGPSDAAPSPWDFQATVTAATHPVTGC
ncbi:hypothetical protein [Allobranchiibius huperziae]|uniref:Uncharacterized protein n=1 Tax=Allobranchiibius huperziae TaxID=1874116 RepID=A0A853DEI5_9MICO|nr:hypothetical protein [Allobranchiibius huperziae]NYJ75882.1 hypothetical protein [Allobranchiibius huperziae]